MRVEAAAEPEPRARQCSKWVRYAALGIQLKRGEKNAARRVYAIHIGANTLSPFSLSTLQHVF